VTESQIQTHEQEMLSQMLGLTRQVNLLHKDKLEADRKSALINSMAKQVADDSVKDAQENETLALLASIGAKACHLQARCQNNADWIALAQQADEAAQRAYEFANKLAHKHSNNSGLS